LHFLIAQAFAQGLTRPKIKDPNESSVYHFRVLPTDIDTYRHMNNSKYLNYMEAARWSYMAKAGLLKVALKRGWIAPIAKIEIKFQRPLKMLQKFEVDVRFIKADSRWFYVYQEFRSNERVVARAMVKSTFRSKEGNVTPEVYLGSVGFSADAVITPELLKPWLENFSNND
jgi:YbgC/YbaW family acyl-CoA thioester hydrolase